MHRVIVLILSIFISFHVIAEPDVDHENVTRAVLDYIEAQHKVEPNLMKRGLDKNSRRELIGNLKMGQKL